MSPRRLAATIAVVLVIAAPAVAPPAVQAQSGTSSLNLAHRTRSVHIVPGNVPHEKVQAGNRGSILAPSSAGSGATRLETATSTIRGTTPTDPRAAALPSLQTGTSFPGFADIACGTVPCVEPPDPWIAAGASFVVQATNTAVRMTDRSGGSPHDYALSTFTADPAGVFGLSDPRIIWDGLHSRWISLLMSGDSAYPNDGLLWLGVSDSADPTAGWTITGWDFQGELPDFPGLGLSSDKVVVTANLYAINSLAFDGADMIVLDAAALFADPTKAPDLEIGYGTTAFTYRPAVDLSPSSEIDVVFETSFATGDIGFSRITGTLAAGTLALSPVEDLTAGSPTLPGFVNPSQPQAFVGASTNPIDGRPTDAIWQNETLWFVSTTECTPATDTAPRNCVRAVGLNTAAATPGLVADITQAAVGQDSNWGGVGVTGNGALVVTWSQASATSAGPISTYASYWTPTDPTPALRTPVLLQAGVGTYTGSRWGDYVGVAQDPIDNRSVWVANEYSTTAGDWATQVVNLSQTEGLSGASFHPIAPSRDLDTRINQGVTGALASGVPVTWAVAGVNGVPANAIAVTGNLTVTQQTYRGYVALTPVPTANPATSTINFPLYDTRANGVTVPLGPGGSISATYITGRTGDRTELIFDVTGYFTNDSSGSTFHSMTPKRDLDTRIGQGVSGELKAGIPVTWQVAGAGNVPANAVAVTGNVTVTQQTYRGYVALTPIPTASPSTSTINFPYSDTRANGVTVPLSGTGTLSATFITGRSTDTTQLIFDVTGYFTNDATGAAYHVLFPTRDLDSRINLGVTGALTSNTPATWQVSGHGSALPSDTVTVTGNVTVTQQTYRGYDALTPAPTADPTTSTINFPLGDTRANDAAAPLSGGGQISATYVTGRTGDHTALIFDVTGYYR